MIQNIILPCEQCIALAMCVVRNLIICDELWNKLENSHLSSEQEILWTAIKERFPNMTRIRWETNPYPVHKWNEPENHIYARVGGMDDFEGKE